MQKRFAPKKFTFDEAEESMTEIQIRDACSDDWPTIVEFNCLLAEESEDKTLDRGKIEPGVKAILDDFSKGRYFLACSEDKVVGQLMHTREWSDWRNGQIWWLQSVYIEMAFRRQGIFRQLYRHAIQLAKDDPEVVGIRLYVENENTRALETYRSLGMIEAGYHVLEYMLP